MGTAMSHRLRLPARASLPAAAIALLAGCGGATKTVTISANSTPASSPGSAQGSAPGSAPGSAGGVTAPGARLAVGQAAIVPYNPPSAQATTFRLKVTVESIEKGTLADFHGIQLDATEKASTPYYVKVRIENLSPGDAARADDPSVAMEGLDSTNQTQQSVTFLGDFPRCDDKTPPKPLSQGKAFETCLVYLVPGGIKAAAYTGTSKYFAAPVTWPAG
jgi:hypothetical protein